MKSAPLKHILMIVAGLAAVGTVLLVFLWLTSPDRLGRAAFAATGLPERTLEEAKTLAQAQNKPLLIEFSAYWCRFCRKMDLKVLADARVKAHIDESYIFVRIDSEHPDTDALMRAYGVQGYPRFLIAGSNGELIRVLPPAYEPELFLQNL